MRFIAQIIAETKDAYTCNLAIWCLGNQRISARVLIAELEPLLTAAIGATKNSFESEVIQVEGLSAALHLCRQAPKAMVTHLKIWLVPVIQFSVSRRHSIRDKAEHILGYMAPFLIEQPALLEPAVGEFFSTSMADFTESFHLLQCRDPYRLRLWAHLVCLFGKFLVQSEHLTQFLRIIERCFNSEHKDTRKHAFQAWSRMIYAFGLVGLNDRKITLLMKPIENTFQDELVPAVREGAARVWFKLMYVLGNKVLALFDKVVEPVLFKMLIDNLASVRQFGYRFTKALASKGAVLKESDLGRVLDDEKSLDVQVGAGDEWFCQNATILTDMCVGVLSSQSDRAVGVGEEWTMEGSVHLMPTPVTQLWERVFKSVGAVEPETETSIEMAKRCIASLKSLKTSAPKNQQDNQFQLAFHLIESIRRNIPPKVLASHAYAIEVDSKLLTPHKFLFHVLMRACGQQGQAGVFEKVSSLLSGDFDILLGQVGMLVGMLDDVDGMSLWVQLADRVRVAMEGFKHVSSEEEHSLVNVLLYPLRQLHRFHAETTWDNAENWAELWMRLFEDAKSKMSAKSQRLNKLCLDLAMEMNDRVLIHAFEMFDGSFKTLIRIMDTILNSVVIPAQKSQQPATKSVVRDILMRKRTSSTASVVEATWNLDPIMHALSHLISISYQRLPRILESFDQLERHSELTAPLFHHLGHVYERFQVEFGLRALPFAVAGLKLWLLDTESYVSEMNLKSMKGFYLQIESAWTRILTWTTTNAEHKTDSEWLAKVWPILQLGFQTRQSRIINLTIQEWDKSFGKAAVLEYPDELRRDLQRVKNMGPICLPAWKEIPLDSADFDDNSASAHPPSLPACAPSKKLISIDVSQDAAALPPAVPVEFGGTLGQALRKAMAETTNPSKETTPFSSLVTRAQSSSVVMEDNDSPLASKGQVHAPSVSFESRSGISGAEPGQMTTSTRKRALLTPHQREMKREKKVVALMYTGIESQSAHHDESSQESLSQDQPPSQPHQSALSCTSPMEIVPSTDDSSLRHHPPPAPTTTSTPGDLFKTPKSIALRHRPLSNTPLKSPRTWTACSGTITSSPPSSILKSASKSATYGGSYGGSMSASKSGMAKRRVSFNLPMDGVGLSPRVPVSAQEPDAMSEPEHSGGGDMGDESGLAEFMGRMEYCVQNREVMNGMSLRQLLVMQRKLQGMMGQVTASLEKFAALSDETTTD